MSTTVYNNSHEYFSETQDSLINDTIKKPTLHNRIHSSNNSFEDIIDKEDTYNKINYQYDDVDFSNDYNDENYDNEYILDVSKDEFNDNNKLISTNENIKQSENKNHDIAQDEAYNNIDKNSYYNYMNSYNYANEETYTDNDKINEPKNNRKSKMNDILNSDILYTENDNTNADQLNDSYNVNNMPVQISKSMSLTRTTVQKQIYDDFYKWYDGGSYILSYIVELFEYQYQIPIKHQLNERLFHDKCTFDGDYVKLLSHYKYPNFILHYINEPVQKPFQSVWQYFWDYTIALHITKKNGIDYTQLFLYGLRDPTAKKLLFKKSNFNCYLYDSTNDNLNQIYDYFKKCIDQKSKTEPYTALEYINSFNYYSSPIFYGEYNTLFEKLLQYRKNKYYNNVIIRSYMPAKVHKGKQY